MKNLYLLKATLLLPFILLPNRLSKKNNVFTLGPHVFKQIAPNERSELCIMGGPIEFYLSLKYKTGFINTSLVYFLLTLNLFTIVKARWLLQASLNRVLKIALKINNGQGVLIHHSDALPYGRLINHFFQKNGFSTVCFQHGYFDDSVIDIDGTFSDFNIAIDNNQLDILKNKIGFKSKYNLISKISIQNVTYCKNRKKKHCMLLGEGWKSHNVEVHKNYIDYIIKIRSKISSSNITVRYRPHPSEKLDIPFLFKMRPIVFVSRGEGINCQDTYIGASSSLLAEAAKIGATSISVEGLVPTSTIRNSNVQCYEKEFFFNSCHQLLEAPLNSCKGHLHEYVSIKKLLLYINNHSL